MATKPLAYSYSRFSTPGQREGDSIRRQAAARDGFLQRHGLTLDSKLQLVDEGVSSFRGRHRDDQFALGQFIKAVDQGRVPRGSYLIVESLDRLSREHVQTALKLLLDLLGKGIKVVQLIPVEQVFDSDSEMIPLMLALMELSRGNSESRVKSERLTAVWSKKKAAARSHRTAMTAMCPGWLRKVGDRYEPIPERVATVNRIFDLSAAGYGIASIIGVLNREGHKPFGRSPVWRDAVLHRLLKRRTVLGEHQPRRRGQPDGDPIPNYFPAVVTESLYYQAQAGLRERGRRKGSRSKHGVNLFQGLLVNAVDGEKMEYKWFAASAKKQARPRAKYTNVNYRGKVAPFTSFPADKLEHALLSSIEEVDATVVNPGVKAGESTTAVEEQLRETQEQLKRVVDQIVAGGAVAALATAAARLEARKTELAGKLAELRQRESQPGLTETKNLLAALAAAPDQEEARLRLQVTLARVVDRILCLIVREGKRETALCQILFRDSPIRRTVVALHRGELQHGDKKTPEFFLTRTLLDEESRELRLEDTGAVKRATDWLTQIVSKSWWKSRIERR